MKVRLLLADDHPLIVLAVELILSGSRYDLVGRAESGEQTLALALELDPDILLLDVNMPNGTGLEVLAELRRAKARQKIVLVTAGLNPNQIATALRLAPDGLIAKGSQPDALLLCLDQVWAGEQWIDPAFREQLDRAESLDGGMNGLTARERDLVALVGQGLRNREISEQLNITEGTVKAYLHTIFGKTGVNSRTELALRAREVAVRSGTP
ncbi:MAG: response regulator transcription factor [Sphingomicrobium sp.]